MNVLVSRFLKSLKMAKKDIVIIQRHFDNLIPEDLKSVEQGSWDFYLKSAVTKIVNTIELNVTEEEEQAINGLYLGIAGVAYMYYILVKNPVFANKKENYLRRAQEYIKPAINFFLSHEYRQKSKPSFLLGSCGIFAISACIYRELNVNWLSEKYYSFYVNAGQVCYKIKFLKCGCDELFVGRAGYILGYLFLSRELGKSLNLAHLYKILDAIVESGRKQSIKKNSECPLLYTYYKKQYIGASHGLSTILLAILSVPKYLQERHNYYDYIKDSVDYLVSLQQENGNFPILLNDSSNLKLNPLTQWCHGSSGIVYLLAKAYLIWNDLKYFEALEKCAENVWKFGLLTKGPGLCHGIAGNGYVFLLMYRLTQQQKYLDKAFAFAKFMESEIFKKTARIPDNPFSLFEGVAGTALYLNDLMQPDQASFPFLDVFAEYSVFNSTQTD